MNSFASIEETGSSAGPEDDSGLYIVTNTICRIS